MACLNVLNAAINVKPQGPGAGRGQTQGNLTFSWKPGVKFPFPQAPTESQFPAPGVTFSIRVKTWLERMSFPTSQNVHRNTREAVPENVIFCRV